MGRLRRANARSRRPRLGAIPLAKITPEHVRALLRKLAAGGLSATTVAMVRDTLATAFRRAVKDRIIAFSPLDAVDTVPRSKPHSYALTAEQARALLHAAAGDPLEALYVVALRAGLRRSELLRLRWRDIDLDAGTLTVRLSLIHISEPTRPY